MQKSDEMAELRAEALTVHSRVCDPDSSMVWGEGDLDASLMIVGEAPGAREDQMGRPFVGPTGPFLDDELLLAGIRRARAYVTSAVKCRYVRPGTSANRAPTREEVDAWRGVLLRQIEIISPRIILCLGSIAASALIHSRFSLDEERGRWFTGPFGIRTLATYHPAYLRRFARSATDQRRQRFRADLRAVAEAAGPTTTPLRTE